MIRTIACIISLCCCLQLQAQDSLQTLLKKYNTEQIPYIQVAELVRDSTDVILLDSREPREFKVSHLKNAVCVGYDRFDLAKTLNMLPKDKRSKIVVYCSLGIRSEDIAEQLYKAGYTNVFNLYGGIFEWKNQGNPVFDARAKLTEKVHTFNKTWGQWLQKGKKVY